MRSAASCLCALSLRKPFLASSIAAAIQRSAIVEQVPAPTLRKGDIVFMDNLRTYKIAGVREAIEAVGARVPIYRPTRPTSIQSSRPSPPHARSTPCTS